MQMFWIDNAYRIHSKDLHPSIKSCSRTPIIREMQIKSTMRCHYIPLSVAIIKKTKDDKHGQGEKCFLVHCWKALGKQTSIVTINNSMEVPQRKLELPHDLAIPFCIYT